MHAKQLDPVPNMAESFTLPHFPSRWMVSIGCQWGPVVLPFHHVLASFMSFLLCPVNNNFFPTCGSSFLFLHLLHHLLIHPRSKRLQLSSVAFCAIHTSIHWRNYTKLMFRLNSYSSYKRGFLFQRASYEANIVLILHTPDKLATVHILLFHCLHEHSLTFCYYIASQILEYKCRNCVLNGGAPTLAGTSMFIMSKFFCTHTKCEVKHKGIWKKVIYDLNGWGILGFWT